MVKAGKFAVLILIDVQKGFDDKAFGERNNPDAESVMSIVLNKFRSTDRTVIHVRHDSLNPASLLKEGKPGFEFKNAVTPSRGEKIITKHVHSAFIGTNLESMLRDLGSKELFIAGLTTDHCVSSTARMAGDMGFMAFVISDACAAHERKGKGGKMIPAEEVHQVNLASIDGEFARVVKSSDLEFD